MKKTVVKINESKLYGMIAESVKKALHESSYYYDDDDDDDEYYYDDDYYENYNKDNSNNNDDDDQYFYDEYIKRNSREDYPEGKKGDIDYSWNKLDYDNGMLPQQLDIQHDMLNNHGIGREAADNWNDNQLELSDEMKNKWINGEKTLDDMDKQWDEISESIIRKAVKSSIKEIIKK